MEQLAPAASVDPHALAPVATAKSVGLAPAIVIPVMFNVALPVLERVADIAALVVPAVKLPNGIEAGVSEATGAGAAVPVPVRVAVCGEPVALSATCKVAVKLLAEAGVNMTEIVQLDPAASELPQVLVWEKSLGLAPPIVTPVMFSAAFPVLESVADANEVLPTVVLAKVRDGVSVATGAAAAVPVPVSVELCGEPVALSATCNVALKLAADAGVKVT